MTDADKREAVAAIEARLAPIVWQGVSVWNDDGRTPGRVDGADQRAIVEAIVDVLPEVNPDLWDDRPEVRYLGTVGGTGGGTVEVIADRELGEYPDLGARVYVATEPPTEEVGPAIDGSDMTWPSAAWGHVLGFSLSSDRPVTETATVGATAEGPVWPDLVDLRFLGPVTDDAASRLAQLIDHKGGGVLVWSGVVPRARRRRWWHR